MVWQWPCISVQDAAPWLPQLLQAASNGSNHIGRQAREMQAAMLLASAGTGTPVN